MNDHQPCDDTSNNTTLSSSPNNQTSEQGKSGKSGTKKQKRQLETESVEDERLTRYQLYDLKLLTFKPIGSNQEVDIWHATPEQFHAYVSQFSHGFEKVNVNIWPLMERLALINAAWIHFQNIGRPFPFTGHQHLVPDVDAGTVPDVDGNSGESSSKVV